MPIFEKLTPRLLFVAASFAAAAWVFFEVAGEVQEGETRAFDQWLMLSLRASDNPSLPLGPPWLESAARDITSLGSQTVIGLVVVIATVFLVLAQRRRSAMFVLVSSVSGTAMVFVLKALFNRPRPELFPHGDIVLSASFPSGHAMVSALVYLTLGAMLARLARPALLKCYILAAAMLLTLLIGCSRVYLGVHWPTDVLAGWAGGTAWALAWWGVAELNANATSTPEK